MNDQITQYQNIITVYRRRVALLCLILLIATVLALLIGRFPTVGLHSPMAVFSHPLLYQIVVNIRLPRILLALFGGASLAVAGFVFQMLFANPLVEPGFLGVSQGAAFGAASAITLWGFSATMIQISATFFGLLGLFLAYFLAKQFRFGGWILRLVLSGIAVGALFSAGLSIVKLVADPTTSLQEITFWMMGGLYNSTWNNTRFVLPIMGISLFLLYIFRWRINILSLEDRTAHSMGIVPQREKPIVLFIATVTTTAIISVAGLVGWVGLIVPHIGRRIFGSDARFALPGTALLGALFLLISDTIGRTLLSSEIPLGVITSLVGALLFIVILSRKRTGVSL